MSRGRWCSPAPASPASRGSSTCISIDGLIDDIAAAGAAAATVGARRIELDGRWVIPGLWDHHVHFSQWAMVSRRLDLVGAASAADVAALVAASVAAGANEVIGFGFRDASGPTRRAERPLDAVTGDVPM